MLKIERASNGRVVLSLSGTIGEDDVAELERLVSLEEKGKRLVLNLEHITRVDRPAVKFLKRCAERDVALENCPMYIREWLSRDSE